jgi:hypothetical protein
MKKGIILTAILLLVCFLTLPAGVNAYTIDDPANDSIGVAGEFETYGIDVSNIFGAPIIFELYTNYQNGLTVGTWTTYAADLFIDEYYDNPGDSIYNPSWVHWAIPLVDHDGFIAGKWYLVDSVYTSNDFRPNDGVNYVFNENVPVWMKTGSVPSFGSYGGAVDFSQPGKIVLSSDVIFEDDPNAYMNISWATATCANDVISGTVGAPVPEPATMLLLGSGLVGLAGFGRKKLFKK